METRDIIVDTDSVTKFQHLITDIALIASLMASNTNEDHSGLVMRLMGVDILESATDIVETVFGLDSSVAMLAQVQQEVEATESNVMKMLDEFEVSSPEELIEIILDKMENEDD